MRLWISVEEASPYLGETPAAIYRAIREGGFPWEFVRVGERKIKISARSIGLIPALCEVERPQKTDGQFQGERLDTTA